MREGIKAVIDGSLLAIGGRYVIAMRLVSAQTGEALATFRETANDPVMEKVDNDGHVIGFSVLAVSKLSGKPLEVALH